jgi:hypothetical protein
MLKHELPTRLRFKLPFLKEPSLDFAYLEANIGAMPQVVMFKAFSLSIYTINFKKPERLKFINLGLCTEK